MNNNKTLLPGQLKNPGLASAWGTRTSVATLLTTSLLSVLAPAYAAADTPEKDSWRCRATTDNSGWRCEVITSAPQAAAFSVNARQSLTAAQLDWVAAEQLSSAQQEALKPGCCGTYIAPSRDDAEATMAPESAPLRASADTSESFQNSTIVLQGNVHLTQGYRELDADKATLNQAEDQAYLEGNLLLREPGVLITGRQAQLNTGTGAASIDDASYLMHDAAIHGESGRIELSETDVLTMNQGSYTSCDPVDPFWQIKGSEIEIDPNTHQGTGKHVRMMVKGVPVLYTPYIRFPVGDQRQSGLLFPAISASADSGLDVAVPYYFNLAPNYDLTLTPRFITDRGTMLEADGRHLSPWLETDLGLAFLSSDDGGKVDKEDLSKTDSSGNPLTLEDLQPFKGEDRWLVSLQQNSTNNDARWYSQIDLTRVSDVDYFRDLGVSSFDASSTTHLKQLGEVGYDLTNWHMSIAAEEYQTLDIKQVTPYKQLPRIIADGSYQWGDWVLGLDHEIIRFDHRNDVWNDNPADPRITGDRAYTDYQLSWEKEWLWGFFKPAAMVKSLNYRLDDEDLVTGAEDQISITVPQGALDTGLFFEREGSLLGYGYIQTFEPRLYYFYSDYENQDELFDLTATGRDIDFDTSELTFSYSQLFNSYRFSGHDRIGDDNRLSVGLTSRFIEAATGIERFSASIGQIHYFDDRRISLIYTSANAGLDTDNLANESWLASQLAARIGDNWQWRADITWDDNDSDRVQRGGTSLRYSDEQQRIFNLGYRYSRRAGQPDTNDIDNDGDTTELINNDIDQLDLSTVWPIAGNWSFIGRGMHDLTRRRELETLFGFEYSSCCYRMRLVGRRWLDNDQINLVDDTQLEYDQGIFFEFQFRGLGSTGGKITGILNDSIIGFEQREASLK